MKIIATQTGFVPFSLPALRQQYPGVSFPKNPDLVPLTEYGVVETQDDQEPDYDPETHAAVLNDPELDNGTWVRRWTVTQHTTAAELLEKKRAEKHVQRKLALDQAQQSTFEYNGEPFASDPKSFMLINGGALLAFMAQASGNPAEVAAYAQMLGAGWRNAHGNPRVTDAQHMVELAKALATHIATTDAVNQQHKAAIDAATTIEELAAIDPTTGY